MPQSWCLRLSHHLATRFVCYAYPAKTTTTAMGVYATEPASGHGATHIGEF